MEIIQLLADIILALVVIYLGTIEKRLSEMQRRQEALLKREEAKEIIDLEIKTISNEQSNLKEDLQRIEGKVDKLLDKITRVVIS